MKQAWNLSTKKFEYTPKNVSDFLADLNKLYKKHNLAISHEDSHGGFIIVPLDELHVDWITAASFKLNVDKVDDGTRDQYAEQYFKE